MNKTFGLWEKLRVGWFERTALKHYYRMWNRWPVQVQCMKQGTQSCCTVQLRGMGWGVRWEVFQNRDTGTPVLIHVSSVQLSRSVVSDSLQPHESQHTRPPCPLSTPGVYPNSCPSSRWCHPTISSSVVPFSSCLQSIPASGSFPMSQLFTRGGQSIGVSASASVLKNTQDSSLGWNDWISLQSKGLSRVFSNTTVQKHQFFGAQPSLWSSSHIHIWLL